MNVFPNIPVIGTKVIAKHAGKKRDAVIERVFDSTETFMEPIIRIVGYVDGEKMFGLYTLSQFNQQVEIVSPFKHSTGVPEKWAGLF